MILEPVCDRYRITFPALATVQEAPTSFDLLDDRVDSCCSNRKSPADASPPACVPFDDDLGRMGFYHFCGRMARRTMALSTLCQVLSRSVAHSFKILLVLPPSPLTKIGGIREIGHKNRV